MLHYLICKLFANDFTETEIKPNVLVYLTNDDKFVPDLLAETISEGRVLIGRNNGRIEVLPTEEIAKYAAERTNDPTKATVPGDMSIIRWMGRNVLDAEMIEHLLKP